MRSWVCNWENAFKAKNMPSQINTKHPWNKYRDSKLGRSTKPDYSLWRRVSQVFILQEWKQSWGPKLSWGGEFSLFSAPPRYYSRWFYVHTVHKNIKGETETCFSRCRFKTQLTLYKCGVANGLISWMPPVPALPPTFFRVGSDLNVFIYN